MKRFESSAALAAAVGETYGPGEWLTVDQDRINGFAEVTGDHQWIHVDIDRAKAEAPGGTTIAHGYLVLSLLGSMLPQVFEVNARTILNYGIDKLRFLAPVPTGSRIRASMTIAEVEPASGGYKVLHRVAVEVEGSAKPAIAADIVFLYFD